MNILVLHNIEDFRRVRRSTLDYLLCFERYQPLHHYHYQRILDPPPREVAAARWDAVIIDSTALGIVTIRPRSQYFHIRDQWEFLRKSGITKLVFPQDDANCGGLMDDWFIDWGVEFVFSVRARKHWPLLYPRSVKSAEFHDCLPGYIDDASLPELRAYSKAWTKRSRLIGQRVTMYPPRGGRQGRMKGVIAEAIKTAAAERGLKADISTDPSDTLFGDDWYRFLGDCQFVVATEGGLSIHDPYGEIADRIDAFMAVHPGASFEEIETACFPGLDGQHVFSGFTPRILEAAVCGASQVLVEGDYLGILEPGVHYLPVRQDGSNIEAVLDDLGDRAAARARIAACDRVLVDNPAFRYSALASRALLAISGNAVLPKRPVPAFDRAASSLSYIDRLAEQQRSVGFRWPELGDRVAERVVSQLVPDRPEAEDPDFVRYRAFVRVFQNELGRLSSCTEVEGAAGRFVSTFQQTASAWQRLAAKAWSGTVAEEFKAMANAFAGVNLEVDEQAQRLHSTGPVLSAFGAAPELAALAEDIAGVHPGSGITRFTSAVVQAGLHGLASRLAPAQGYAFTEEEIARLERLEAVIIRSAGGGLDALERFQAHAPKSALLLDTLTEGGDVSRALLALAAGRAPLLGLLSRLAPAQGYAFTEEEIERLKRLDTLIIRSADAGLDALERFQAHAPKSALLLDTLTAGGGAARALLAFCQDRVTLEPFLSRLAPDDGDSFSPGETARLLRLDEVMRIIGTASTTDDIEQLKNLEALLSTWQGGDLSGLRGFLEASLQAEATLQSVKSHAQHAPAPVEAGGFQLLFAVVRALGDGQLPAGAAGFGSVPADRRLAKLTYRLVDLRQSDPVAFYELVSALSGIRALVANIRLWNGRVLIVRIDEKV